MAPRATWKGYLKLSLVSCPIALYPAASNSERVSFNRINKKTGNRLKQQLVDGHVPEAPKEEPAPHRVINLMDALRASIGAAKKKPAAASSKARAGARGKAAKRKTGR